MFTGIIQAVGRIKDIERKRGFARITIEHNGDLSAINTGDSVAIDGACLTVVDFSPSLFRADISGETLSLTTLGNIKTGEKVNLEKSLTPSTPLGGHFVTGHIELQGQLAKKGSVAVDGISLTVVDIFENGFRTAVIPHTLRDTTLSGKTKGDNVNIETDIIAKYVQRFLLTYNKQGIDETFLKGHGFIEG